MNITITTELEMKEVQKQGQTPYFNLHLMESLSENGLALWNVREMVIIMDILLLVVEENINMHMVFSGDINKKRADLTLFFL